MDFSKKSIDLSSSILKSLGHPIRISIVLSLSNNSQLTVSELCDRLLVSQPVMSLHLGILREKKIISVKKRGKQSLYSIVNHSVNQIVRVIYNSNISI